ncbi:elongation factor 1-beta [Oxyplasma meridianum]|uniref:Elongation factor 1-beta n=1 Tax=Oxyplasma meridianum TaxID=3073602 RepID=A0AAX4NGI7_9ARCH
MGDVAVVFKILPGDAETDMKKLSSDVRERINGFCEINKIEMQEIGFGLSAIRLEVIVPDEEGKITKVEEILGEIDGVGQVDTEDVTLV